MAHEMGHYVLNHVYKALLFFFILIAAGLAFVAVWSLTWVVKRKGAAWDIRGVGDTAGLPLFVLIISFYLFLLTPITNSFIRTLELEADLFGLNASRQPDGVAEVELKVGEYKARSGPNRGIAVFDHPASRRRIRLAMQWKAESMQGIKE